MTDTLPVEDAAAREQALDPTRSFITQAPAGSGKTGLLTQRFLRLLARVEAPEEIIAITFTRKAAGEMQERILEALAQAESDTPPADAHERTTWQFAREALVRDRERDWQLRANPSRLRVQTIDSLCAALARQMPLLSRFGAVPATVEDAQPLYLDAARQTIAELESGDTWSDAIDHLIRHLDNRLDYLQALIASMLARRDQWLRHVADRSHPRLERASLEAGLQRMVEEGLAAIYAAAPQGYTAALWPLVRFAAANVPGDSPIAGCIDMTSWPGSDIASRPQWEALARLLQTAKGEWRSKLTKNEGFPAKGATREETGLFQQRKTEMGQLLEQLRAEPDFCASLAALARLPPHKYSDLEWETLQALFEILRLAAGQLELVFQERGQVDFTAMAQAALQALGNDDEPTELALALDYQVRHLLVDEFQDTSLGQQELLQRLTAGWQTGDGRTLFLVGDPMQSIYRFREAEVGLFLEARKQGIGDVTLEPLQLTVNFRSQQGIVDWVNDNFPHVLPTTDNVADGAVSYASSVAFRGALPGDAVTVHPYLGKQPGAEAEQVVALIQEARAEDPDASIAVLVRGRSHLADIVPLLKAVQLRFRAVEIEALAHRPVVQDLLALTRALDHRADRIAWLAVLRAPWCGLSLADLHVLAGGDHVRVLPDSLDDAGVTGALSTDGRARLDRVWPVLRTALAQRGRNRLRATVEGTWLALGGPACVTDATDIEDAEVFLQLLEGLDEAGSLPGVAELEKRVSKLYALPDVQADDRIQLMTIHKSKGLEFDTVIVPGLGRQPRGEEAALLTCMERPREPEGSDLLLAPIKAAGDDVNPIASHLNRLSQRKGKYEDGRLLYVAATRARKRLHLLGHADVQDSGGEPAIRPPRSDTLLASLWCVVEDRFHSVLATGTDNNQAPETTEPVVSLVRHCLPEAWSCPPPPEGVRVDTTTPAFDLDELLEFTWAGEAARHVGTVVHEFLQHLSLSPTGESPLTFGDAQRHLIRQRLLASGIPGDLLDDAVSRVIRALDNVQRDQRGRWILDATHTEAGSELPLTGHLDGKLRHVIIDRTFVDADGVRWIIDYKTGSHGGGNPAEFLDREQERYRSQLENYAALMRQREDRPIRLGLYFPLMTAWREWSWEN